MNEKAIRWAIVGTSPISKTMAHAITASAQGRITAVCARDSQRLSAFADEWHVQHTYTDYDALLADPEVDVVYLGVPDHHHKDFIVKASTMKKHVLCEKPFVLNHSEAVSAIEAVERNHGFCMEALMYQCHPFFQAICDVVHSGRLGQIRLINAFYSANIVDRANKTAGGSILNLGCYPVSLVRAILKAEPQSIAAFGRLSDDHADRTSVGLFTFEHNTMAYIGCADDLAMAYDLRIVGTLGNLKVLSNPWLPTVTSSFVIESPQGAHERIEVTSHASAYEHQINMVNHKIATKQLQGTPSLTDSLNNIRVLEAWLATIKEASHIKPSHCKREHY